jgi:hypothetical protein
MAFLASGLGQFCPPRKTPSAWKTRMLTSSS